MYVNKKGDWAAATNALDTMGVNAKTFPPGVLDALKGHFIAGWGGYPLVGTKEQIVEGLETLSRIGLDGVLLSWPLYIPGMREFRDVTYPLVKQAGLRDPR
jgi:alkanesulfonate monooxygenase SsuD/methylene tetrahydromethanopterin reductase-like flavin-dependent oxidoreductase (luciferase family)